jgi:hypothetical protein
VSVYDLHFNKDNVALRNILVGSLATISEHIGWNNQIGTSVEQKKAINVPFYFSTTGSERYLNDNFLNNIDFDPDLLNAEAFYSQIPRGIVDFSSFSIETQAITNKYVRMDHIVQEDDGTLNQYNSEAFMVPIIMTLKIEIYVDSILDQLKCSEAIIRTFYKAKAYNVDIGYTRIPCLMLFSDDMSLDRSVEFSFTDKKEFKVSFDIEIKSYIPVFKDGTAIFAGNNMGGVQSNISVTPNIIGPTAPSPTSNSGSPNITTSPLSAPVQSNTVNQNSGINACPSTNSYIFKSGNTWKGEWLCGNSYIVEDLVEYNGISYVCISNINEIYPCTIPPENKAHWALCVCEIPYNRELGDIPSWPIVNPSALPPTGI